MAEQTKSNEELAAEKRQKALALHSAISHFEMKLRFVDNSTKIEDQIISLSNYNDIPSKEEVAQSNVKLDSYRREFVNQLHDNYFKENPEMLERLGDKKSDDNELNFAALGVLSYILSSHDDETLKKEHNASVNEYYGTVLPQYNTYLINYIIDNKKWELTINNETAFALYADIYNKHREFVDIHFEINIMTDIHLLIRDVVNTLVDKIAQAKEAGLDDNTYSNLISNTIIHTYKLFNAILNRMAEEGRDILQTYIYATFKEYTIDDIYNSIPIIESKLSLDEKQHKELENSKKILDLLREKGVILNSKKASGCLGVIIAFIIPLSLLALL